MPLSSSQKHGNKDIKQIWRIKKMMSLHMLNRKDCHHFFFPSGGCADSLLMSCSQWWWHCCNSHTNSCFNSSRFSEAAVNNYRFVIINQIPFLTRYEIAGDPLGLLFESSQLRGRAPNTIMNPKMWLIWTDNLFGDAMHCCKNMQNCSSRGMKSFQYPQTKKCAETCFLALETSAVSTHCKEQKYDGVN